MVELLSRSFNATAQVSDDGRHVETLTVPWDRDTTVSDVINGSLISYRERFARGALQRAEQVPRHVALVYGHSNDYPNRLGRGVEFRNEPHGEVGVFVLEGNSNDRAKAREMLDGMGVSMQFHSLRPRHGQQERAGALVTRQDVHLVHVAVVPEGAYPDARVLAMREAALVEQAAANEQAAKDAEMRAAILTLQSAGGELTQTMRDWLDAHPAPAPEHEPLPDLPDNHAEALNANLSIGNGEGR